MRIQYICQGCRDKKSTNNFDFKRKKNKDYCRPCSISAKFKQINQSRWNKLRPLKNQYEIAKKIILSGSINTNNKWMYEGQKSLSRDNSIQKLKTLKINKFPKNTEELKNKAFEFIMKNNEFYFKFISEILLSAKITSNRIESTKTHKYYRLALDQLGFKYKTDGKTLVVTYGSFYTDGRWVHVG